jgi:hypothetical protein
MSTRKDILFPIGRLVRGSLYKGQDKDAEGKMLVTKTGPNAGQPRLDFYFAVAFPKVAGQTHWAQTEWGAQIWAVGHAAFPQAAASPSFAWKVIDGDSTVPNKKGRKPCDNEGYKGNWVVQFSSGYAPKIFTADGTQQIVEPDAVKLGYFVQVYGSCDGNGSQSQPGVYVNHGMVAMAGYGTEIVVGPDASAVGFGKGAAPVGMMSAPVGGGFNPAPPAPVAPPAAPVAVAPPAIPSVAAAVATVVAPNPAILMPPPPAAVPAAPAAGPVMLPKAAGLTYAQLTGGGWTHEALVQHGYVAA